MRKRALAAPVVLAAVFAAGCGEGTPFVEPHFVASIRLSSGDCSGLRVGGQCTLAAAAFDETGAPFADPLLFWRSTNIVFATVSGSGVVSAHLAGTALIIVETRNRAVADTVTVRVSERPPPPPE